MNRDWRKFAPWGLYLAVAAALVSFGLFVVFRTLDLRLQISLALIVVGLAAAVLLDPERARRFFTGRQARYGSNALLMSLAFIGIVAVLNYLAYQNPLRKDLTEDRQNTLAPETLETLRSLPEPVTAVGFFTARTPSEQAERLLEQYRFYSDGKFTYRIVDPESDPVAAREAGITRDGSIVLRMGDGQEIVDFVSERGLTSALVRLMNPASKTVYFLTGHGEYDLEQGGDQSYALVKRTLEGKNYTVRSLNLLAEHQVPSDADVVVVAGPQQPLTPAEVEALDAYLRNGGALLALEEPLPVTQFGDAPDPLATYLSGTWGLTLGEDIVVDLSSEQPFVAVAAQYAAHPITEKIAQVATVFPTARSVQVSGDLTDTFPVVLVQTGQNSWAESDLAAVAAQENFAADEGDLIGSVPLAAAEERSDWGARVVVFGDSDFASDAYFGFLGDGDLFVNAVDWAAGQENLINLTPKERTQRVLVPPQSWALGLILLGTVFVLPGLALVAGLTTWWQRRRRE